MNTVIKNVNLKDFIQPTGERVDINKIIDNYNKIVEVVNNLKYFINHTIIAGGHGYDYKQALSALLDGSDLEYVLTWYDNVLKGGDE